MYGKASAAVIVDGLIPAASDTEIGALGDDMDKALIVEALQQFCGTVGGVVVYHDDIELEAGFLS